MSDDAMDPSYLAERACNGLPTDTFFPPPSQSRRRRKPLAICASCPVLASCAAWAAPLVESGQLTECVVAGVWVPAHRTQNLDRIASIAEGLRVTVTRAGRGPVGGQERGGAAWTAA
ncbi:WhiB family transcriptional regulator [Nocardia cyriacigeorgica]|uniref:WhiB family transcriptional regulator n=1 Tax=Nocardia cyriacigeorgica TaxID=135487 RepID=UPI0024541EB2|nr:WhiB family transcriptional regulator [Nocardia cyriacigeorgica]